MMLNINLEIKILMNKLITVVCRIGIPEYRIKNLLVGTLQPHEWALLT